ncbi:MAG: FecR family protein [Acidobacteriia bacterium]|nr:FecR family protein [Terriglobia bacterium]
MRSRPRMHRALALWLVVCLAAPTTLSSQASSQTAARAGEVERVIPDVRIERQVGTRPEQLVAESRTPVFWLDTLHTADRARARVRLDDGSALNVGSGSSLRIVQHDAAGQRTQIELQYGRIRSQVVRLAQPGAEFRVRTPVGTAGVIGTDFFLAFEDGILKLIVFEGVVELCNLAGSCIRVERGQTSTLRSAETAGPSPEPPQAVTPAESRQAVESTQVELAPAAGGGKGPGWWVGMLGFAAIGVAAIVLATRPQQQGQRPGQQVP